MCNDESIPDMLAPMAVLQLLVGLVGSDTRTESTAQHKTDTRQGDPRCNATRHGTIRRPGQQSGTWL